MSAILCFLWWLLAGVVLGWLLSWMLARVLKRPDHAGELQRKYDELNARIDHIVRGKDAAIATLSAELEGLRAPRRLDQR